MMGGGAFILLNAGRTGQESAKQTEIRLAILLKMLQIAHFGTAPSLTGEKDIRWLQLVLFPRDMANSPGTVFFVTQFTVLTRRLAQYHANKSG
jgi:hypothetical protein